MQSEPVAWTATSRYNGFMQATVENLTRKKLDPVPLCIGGDWEQVNGIPGSPVFNPSTGEVIAETPMCGAQHVNAAVEAAAAAFPSWSETPPTDRARIFFRFKALLEENFEDLVHSNTREHGKTLTES